MREQFPLCDQECIAALRAIIYTDQLRFTDAHPVPARAAGECLIRVHWAGICATDHEIVRGYAQFRGVLGHEFVGTVIDGSQRWVGKRVVGEINCVCRSCDLCHAGLSNHCRKRTVIGIVGRSGCFADRIALPEDNLHEVPDTLSDEEAVFVEPLAAALQVLQQFRFEKRHRVTVLGSGRLGLLVAQALARTGCHLDVVGRNPATLEFCEKKGIQGVPVGELVPAGDRDVVIDCTGSADGLALAMSLVRPRGTIVLKSTYADGPAVDLAPVVVNEITVLGSRCGPFGEAIHALARRDVDVLSMISRSYPLDRGLEAFEASASSRNIKVLLRIDPA